MRPAHRLVASLLLGLSGAVHAQPLVTGIPTDNQAVPGLDLFIEYAEQHRPFARTETGVAFLDAVSSLPNQPRRYLWVDRQFNRAYTESEYAGLDNAAKRGLSLRPVTELAYYMAIAERPLMDVLALDVGVMGTEMASPSGLAGKRVLLYNPRVITQGRLLASLGADVTVVHDQQRMHALYSERADVGEVPGHDGGPSGKLTLIRSAWPGEGAPGVGEGFDLIIISDWVSRGLSLVTEAPPRWVTAGRPLRPLPSDPDAFLGAMASALKPGGRFICYAYGPIQPREAGVSQPYADVRFPVSIEGIGASGLEVVTLDGDDTRRLISASIATGFKEPKVRAEDGVPSMSAAYTLLVKPEEADQE